jgi:hypothetical protein
VKAFLPAMVQSNSGHLVTIASAAATTGPFCFCCDRGSQEKMIKLKSLKKKQKISL